MHVIAKLRSQSLDSAQLRWKKRKKPLNFLPACLSSDKMCFYVCFDTWRKHTQSCSAVRIGAKKLTICLTSIPSSMLKLQDMMRSLTYFCTNYLKDNRCFSSDTTRWHSSKLEWFKFDYILLLHITKNTVTYLQLKFKFKI